MIEQHLQGFTCEASAEVSFLTGEAEPADLAFALFLLAASEGAPSLVRFNMLAFFTMH